MSNSSLSSPDLATPSPTDTVCSYMCCVPYRITFCDFSQQIPVPSSCESTPKRRKLDIAAVYKSQLSSKNVSEMSQMWDDDV